MTDERPAEPDTKRRVIQIDIHEPSVDAALAVEPVIITLRIRESLRLLRLAMDSGHVEQCLRCADELAVCMRSVTMHALGVPLITSTSAKPESRKRAAKESADAR